LFRAPAYKSVLEVVFFSKIEFSEVFG